MKFLGKGVEVGSSARLRGQGDRRASGMQKGEGNAVFLISQGRVLGEPQQFPCFSKSQPDHNRAETGTRTREPSVEMSRNLSCSAWFSQSPRAAPESTVMLGARRGEVFETATVFLI